MKIIVFALSFTCLLLTGCGDVLYSSLEEKEANEMLSLLNASGIQASILLEKGSASLSVPKDQKASAIDVLYAYGYPHIAYDTVPVLFPSDSLIKSPLEEQVRYNYAVAQSIADMISTIDGVIKVKAQIIMPFKDSKERNQQKNINDLSVSVMIKYSKFVDLKEKIQDITTLVVKSIPRILPNNVGIVMFEAETPLEQGLAYKQYNVQSISQGNDYIVIIIAILFVLLFVSIAVFFYMNTRKNKKNNVKETDKEKNKEDTEENSEEDDKEDKEDEEDESKDKKTKKDTENED